MLRNLGDQSVEFPIAWLLNEDGAAVWPAIRTYPGNPEDSLGYLVEDTGTYYLAIQERDDGVGSYEVSLADITPSDEVYNLDQIAEYMIHDNWIAGGEAPRQFDAGTGDTLTVDLSGLTGLGQDQARWALEAWTEVSGLLFEEVTEDAQVVFEDEETGDHASFVLDDDGFIETSTVNVSLSSFDEYGTSMDSEIFQTYMHEIGHALGLGHSGYYLDGWVYGLDNHYANDSWQATVMSYFSQEDNTSIDATIANPVTTMAADIVAIQELYGSDVSNNDGDTTYGANSNLETYLGALFGQMFAEDAPDPGIYTARRALAFTIFDTGGVDWFDFSPSGEDQMIDLSSEGISNVFGSTGNLVIARDTVIENVRLGDGDDAIFGNGADNILISGGGDDTVWGGAGVDDITTGAGSDGIHGSLEDLNGDNILDFTVDDQIFVTGTHLEHDEVRFNAFTGMLQIDEHQDGTDDSTINLSGDFSGGAFMTARTVEGSVISFETFMPDLAEGVGLDAMFVDGIVNQEFLSQGADDRNIGYGITLDISSESRFDNVLGVYEVDEDGNIGPVRILFPDPRDSDSTYSEVQLSDPGSTLGFFMIQDGADWVEANNISNSLALDTDHLSFIPGPGSIAGNVDDGDAQFLAINGVDSGLTVFHSYDADMNVDGVEHVVSGASEDGSELVIGFEDLTGGGDQDYQDLVFSVQVIEPEFVFG